MPTFKTERMLLVFDDYGQLHLMCRRGPGIEQEDLGTDVEDLGIFVTKDQADGLWVYDAVPRFNEEHDEGYPTGFGTFDYEHGKFRRPTEREWNYIHAGDMKGLFEYWNDIISKVQSEARDDEEKSQDTSADP